MKVGINMQDWTLPAVALGFLLDLLLGDPHWLYHPVRLVGRWIDICEKLLRGIFPKTDKGERAAGFFEVFLVSGMTTLIVWLLVWGCGKVSPWLGFAVQTILCYWLFAVRSLKDESMKVWKKLDEKDLPGARYAVSMIVGRDTASLDEAGVAKAAVETVAENTSDGIIAPMLYMAIGGPVLGWLYKSINTMDSMIGYKNDKYRYFGTAAAKLDDIVNFIPARLSALLMILGCKNCGLDAKNAWRIHRRDRYNHASPNSAQTESVMAGALHIQLAGDAYYFGKLVKKKTQGDPDREINKNDIKTANVLLYVTSILSIVIMLAVRAGAVYLLAR